MALFLTLTVGKFLINVYTQMMPNKFLFFQVYAYVQSRACDSLVQGNVFFNGPRAGININDGFGGGNQIQNNLLFNFVRGKNFRLHWTVKNKYSLHKK